MYEETNKYIEEIGEVLKSIHYKCSFKTHKWLENNNLLFLMFLYNKSNLLTDSVN